MIDVTLVAGPDDEPDPSVVTVAGDVLGRQGDSVLNAGALEATLSRNEEGDLVVDQANAGGGVHFTRASDDIEVTATELLAWPEAERATFVGEESMVRRRTASVFGDQIEIDGSTSSHQRVRRGTLRRRAGERRDGVMVARDAL